MKLLNLNVDRFESLSRLHISIAMLMDSVFIMVYINQHFTVTVYTPV